MFSSPDLTIYRTVTETPPLSSATATAIPSGALLTITEPFLISITIQTEVTVRENRRLNKRATAVSFLDGSGEVTNGCSNSKFYSRWSVSLSL